MENQNQELVLMVEQVEALKQAKPFVELMMYNRCAIREIETKLRVLDEEFSIRADRNPIQTIKSRVKKPISIIEKLQRRGYEVTVQNMQEHLTDIAGVRVICSFIEDIYKLAELLLSQDDIILVEIKDYIKNPKPNGYRSLHLIIEIPIFLSHEKKHMRVEVQFRTIAMDFWASLEHQLKYKKKIENPEKIANELKYCADVITEVDMRMQDIRYMIDEVEKKHDKS
ncbi:MAG: GTP pyrophosphokinase family protein [Lachnospiraceae bacterium]|nr:GTP pyrophosphokinase family protein [Lachnospiraceae bacterium]